MALFKLEIKTPDRLIWSGEIESLIVTHPSGKEGYLANHQPVLKELTTGPIEISGGTAGTTAHSGQHISGGAAHSDGLAVPESGGWLSFSDNKAIILIHQDPTEDL